MKAIITSLFVFLLVSLVSINSAQAQALTLDQLVAVYSKVDLPTINSYLMDLGWQFDKADPNENVDQVVWVHKYSDSSGDNDATLNILFCNSCSNKFCSQCTIHNDSLGRQHAFRLIYKPVNSQSFLQVKRSAEMKHMVPTSTLYERSLRVAYLGATYELDLNTYSREGSTLPEYLIELAQKAR